MRREPLVSPWTLLRVLVLFSTLTARVAAGEGPFPGTAEVLGSYAGTGTVTRAVRRLDLPPDLGGSETQSVLALLERRVGRDSLRARVRRSPSSVARLRLVPTQAFLTLVDLLLLPEDVNRVLQRGITHVTQENVQAFAHHRAVRSPFYCLPEGFVSGPARRRVLNALQEWIEVEGYPLPGGVAEAVVIEELPELAPALARVRQSRPGCSAAVAKP